jgi:hypothetical protein
MDSFDFALGPPSPGGPGEGPDCCLPHVILVCVDPGPDPEGNLFKICVFALSAAGLWDTMVTCDLCG